MHIKRRDPDYAGINKRVEAEFVCPHAAITRCKQVKSNHDIEVRNQCNQCGAKVGHAIRQETLTKREIADLPLWDSHAGGHRYTAKSKRGDLLREEEKSRIYEEWNEQYQAYLQTPEWQRCRKLVLERAQDLCEGCRSAPATEVHHLSYEALGDEFLFLLVALCRPCHARWHGHAQDAFFLPLPKTA